jgi:hypothetical protein
MFNKNKNAVNDSNSIQIIEPNYAALIDIIDRFIELYKIKNDYVADIAFLNCLGIRISNKEDL